jgi:hypothetical protein
MKKVICKKVYDTEASAFLKKVTYGVFGSADGWEECLFQTESGHYFLYTNGGAESKYPQENITRMSAEKKDAWLKANA